MTKIKLNLDSLRVDSFSTSSAEAGRGTVNAQQLTTFRTQQISCDYSAVSCVDECACTNAQMRCKNPYPA